MRTWWLLVRNDGGAMIRVTVQANDGHSAHQIAKRLYGPALFSESANLC